MNKYQITISNGQKKDTFLMQARNRMVAYQTAKNAHIGTGWDVCYVRRV